MDIRKQNLTRYIIPLREGGSLPALAEADDGFKYVVKFRGAGHGEKALVADFMGSEIARAAGMKVPEQVFLELDEYFGQAEGDEEIQDLLKWSRGLNLGIHYLQGAMTADPYVNPVDALLASQIVWLDTFITNVDRTIKNTNMLLWHNEIWLIDHGASFYFHHSWGDWQKSALTQFPYIKDHALLHKATRMNEADAMMRGRLTPEVLSEIVDAIPSGWLRWDEGTEEDERERREVYRNFLMKRLKEVDFVKIAEDARAKQI